MTEDTTKPAPSEPVAGPVQRPVRPAAEARWYCLDRDGVAMLCKDEEDARAQVIENDACWPGRAPHRAVLLGDVAAERERLIKAVESGPPHRWVDGSDQWGQPCPAKVPATKADYVAAMRRA